MARPRPSAFAATTALGLIAFGQVGYPLVLAAWRRLGGARPVRRPAPGDELPRVTLVIAAHDEAAVIEGKVREALQLAYPRERLEVVVTDDASSDGTPELAERAGADRVVRNARIGKVAAQDAAVRRSLGDVIAFSDANATWEPGALRELVAPFADPAVGYACGRVAFVAAQDGTNQEGVYWRYEMALRALESDLGSVTAGNGAIYAVRRSAYVEVDPVMGHDLKLPVTLVRRGWRCVDVATARATEPMVPSVEGEFARKRRMMSHAWAIVLGGGLLDPRGLPPRHVLFLAGHRWLRYATPGLHLVAFAALLGAVRPAAESARAPRLARAALGAHVLLAAGALGGRRLGRGGLLARYYVLTQASVALGLVDHVLRGTEAGWTAAAGTRG